MLDKKYNHKTVEQNKYETWKKKGYFNSGDKSKEPFTIVIPPPNVTGRLHLGHALDTTIQDIIIRYKRMQGFDALWIPGMDHAGIATQSKVDKKLKDEGINPRSMDRDAWLKKAWEWKEEYAKNIHDQWKVLGLSLDYNKERFTLDDGLSKAVRKVFVDLYNEGLIYQGERIINWDPVQMTALSDEEVIFKEDKGAFYHIKYFIEESNDYLEVATTRPETLFGDTAVAVNPKDARYNKYIGKNVVLPIVNKLIPIIADEHADPEFGTGVVKITPAHDPNDYEVGLRHNLPKIIVINKDATMNSNALGYEGLDRYECRKKLIKDLKKEDLLIKIEEIVHNVGHSERSDAQIEPYLSKQWFVKMRPLADKVLENQKNPDTKVNFIPEHYEKTMNHWMEITYDWCISRQLWWGHRIPAWYKDDKVYVGMDAPEEEGWVQDPDVLDTWFSSALWPFSTLGWPEATNDFNRYFPINTLVTGYDIIPFWVNRMTFQSLHFTGQSPFKNCIIHGLIRDKMGRKFSKSLGNGIDPMDMVELYGSDSLRYYLSTNTSNGTDIRFDEEKIKSTWNFINKLWNASRFVLINAVDINDTNFKELKLVDKWILKRLNDTIKETISFMDKFQFNNAGNTIYNFIWSDFCDKYIEYAKFSINDLETKKVLLYVLTNILKLLHPFMPFVTEEIYEKLPVKDAESIMISLYPKYNKDLDFKDTNIIDDINEFIKIFRNIKLENNILKDFKVKLNENSNNNLIINSLKLDGKIVDSAINIKSYIAKYKDFEAIIYYEKQETEEDKKELEKNILELENSIKRRKTLLSNENYVNKAPKDLVEKEREKLKIEEEKLNVLKSSSR